MNASEKRKYFFKFLNLFFHLCFMLLNFKI
nr:MAG TPA: type VI secretion protein [Caudoviricetes sp.]